MTELVAWHSSGSHFLRILNAPDVSNADLEYLVDYITSPDSSESPKQWDMLADIFEHLLEEHELSFTEERFLAAFAIRFDTIFQIPDMYYPILTERVGTRVWMNILKTPGLTRPQGGLFSIILHQMMTDDISVSDLIDAMTTLQDEYILECRLDHRILQDPMFQTCPIHQYQAACERGLKCNPLPWTDYMILQISMGPENVPDWTCKVAISFALLDTAVIRQFPRQLAYTSQHTLLKGGPNSPIWYHLSRGVKQVFFTKHCVDLIEDSSIRRCILDLMSHMIQSGNPDAVETGLLLPSILIPKYSSDCISVLSDLAVKLSRLFT